MPGLQNDCGEPGGGGKEKDTGQKMEDVLSCRGEKTRTSDLVVPNDARCQLRYTPVQI